MALKAWNTDANTIKLNDIKGNELNNLMVMTREIADFLEFDTRKMFIVAPKGFGKTFLLKVKSQLFRENAKGYKFLPNRLLCERFTDVKVSFAKEDIIKFNKQETWEKTWELCLYTLILKNYKSDKIPNSITEIVGEDANSLASILAQFLYNREKIDKIYESEISKLIRRVEDLSDDSSVNQLAIFVDNIDEAFEKYVGINKESISEKIWNNAQLALLLVTNNLVSKNNHIKFYLTIRSEAYLQYNGAQRMQLDDLCVFLSYTKNEIKDIFIKNIHLMKTDELLNPKANDPIEAFLGRKIINHKFVKDDDGLQIEENIFDFIYRHTYRRPREIVEMGQVLMSIDRNDLAQMGDKINDKSYDLFDQLKREVIPFFREDIFRAFCDKVSSNIISYETAVKISNEIKHEIDPDSEPFEYFYKLGLLGIAESKIGSNGGYLKQTFLNVGEYSLSRDKMPITKYFVIHPSLNETLKSIHDLTFYDQFNIIGYDLPLNMNRKNILESHVHFGLDRESITILLPELIHVKSLAVIVLPSSNWSELEFARTFTLRLNTKDNEYSFRVYSESLSDSEKEEILKGWKDKNYPVLLYTDNIETIEKCLESAEVISVCYLTQKVKEILTKVVRKIPFSQEKYIYFCYREYVEGDFNEVRNEFSQLNKTLKYQPVLMDRFQFSKSTIYDPENKIFICEVASESHGCIICYDKPRAALKNSNVVRRVLSNSEFNFFTNRQNKIVEGLYQFYRLLQHEGIIDSSIEILDEFINIQIERVLAELTDADIAYIFDKHRNDVKFEMHEFAKLTKDRLVGLVQQRSINTTDKSRNVAMNKQKKIFPSDKEVYDFISKSKTYYNTNYQSVFLSILSLLECKPIYKTENFFISYSTIDKYFAELVHDRLILKGIDVTLYDKKNIDGSIRKFETNGIKNNNRMIFIASRNSLKSDSCHRELTKCFEIMRANNDMKKLIVISLDDYIFKVTNDDIIDHDRITNRESILKYIHVSNFKEYSNSRKSDNLKKIDHRLTELVNNAYRT